MEFLSGRTPLTDTYWVPVYLTFLSLRRNFTHASWPLFLLACTMALHYCFQHLLGLAALFLPVLSICYGAQYTLRTC